MFFWWMKYASYKIVNNHKFITMLLLLKNILKSQNGWTTKLSLLRVLWTSNKFIFSTIWLRTKNMSANNQVKWNKIEHLDTICGNLPSRWMKNNIEYFVFNYMTVTCYHCMFEFFLIKTNLLLKRFIVLLKILNRQVIVLEIVLYFKIHYNMMYD